MKTTQNMSKMLFSVMATLAFVLAVLTGCSVPTSVDINEATRGVYKVAYPEYGYAILALDNGTYSLTSTIVELSSSTGTYTIGTGGSISFTGSLPPAYYLGMQNAVSLGQITLKKVSSPSEPVYTTALEGQWNSSGGLGVIRTFVFTGANFTYTSVNTATGSTENVKGTFSYTGTSGDYRYYSVGGVNASSNSDSSLNVNDYGTFYR
ncbi:hypothetical protein FACS189494_05480 [Spirochaetia bacterium]|nr:hypothetical protein FACS189494_05480 [Spirochaetia bacterium]